MTLSSHRSRIERHFQGIEQAPTAEAHRAFAILRLLEEGDRGDLAWLAGRTTRDELRAIFQQQGGRKLSARSRRFWARLFGVAPPAPPALAEELWPLS